MASAASSAAPLLESGAAASGAPGSPAGQRAPRRVSRHLRTLLRKNGLLKRREWSATCCPWCPFAAFCELLLPLAVLALLWWAKVQCNEGDGGQCQLPVLAGWGGTMPKDLHATACTQGLLLQEGEIGLSSCAAWSSKGRFMRPTSFMEVLSYLHWSNKSLALAVDLPEDRAKAHGMREWISENWHPDLKMNDIPCVDLETDITETFADMGHHKRPKRKLGCNPHKLNPGILPSFSKLTDPKIYTADELQNHLDSPDYGSHGLLFGAVVFHSMGGDGSVGAAGEWSYSIRLNVTARTTPYTGMPKTRPLDLGLKMGQVNTYVDNGFMSLQILLNRYIIGKKEEHLDRRALLVANGISLLRNESEEVVERLAEACSYLPQAVETVPMPVAGIVLDGFYQLVSVAFPLVFIVAFLYTQKKVINELITEKETKVRESLRMMGVGSFAIIGSWYVTYAAIFAVLCAIFTAVAQVQVFPNSNSVLIFLLFWLWCMSFLSFALFIHSFFNNSRTGGIVGMTIMFAQWILNASQNKGGPPSETVQLLLNTLPNAAFSCGLSIVAKYEAAKVGVTWNNVTWPVSNSSFALVLLMMCVDVALWALAGWYLDRVLPKEYGVRLPFYFPCQRSYWLSRPASSAPDDSEAAEEDGADCPAVAVGERAVEAVQEAVRARSRASGVMVRTLGLRKEFATPGGAKVAVAGLDMTMYEGQILALLGHNGAGKTTTIHMLTGMVEPSAGDAQILGYSVLRGMGSIRQIIGVCPQHDVLWLELTVKEHLRVYASLRGVAASEVEQRARDMMHEVGLTEKAATRAGSLSGGQKRKLSLCLALVGRPKVVFLDEPTSGMDPFSRRSTWNIIRGVREGRVTVLTTHFMDEADILGDRIAILAGGVLQCCGSSLFLKNRFGAGYRITCARVKDGAASHPSKAVVSVIQRHVPEAELLTDVGAELSLRLPMSAASGFPGLFAELDGRMKELGLEHYGLSMVTLEEVFLRVASGEMERLEANRQGGAAAQEAPAAAPAAPSAFSAPAASDTSRRPWYHEVRFIARHLGSLFMKRARYGRRDCKSVSCTVLLPVVMLAFGLWLLQKVSDRHVPAMGLGLEEQFGRVVDLPYVAEGNDSWVAAAAKLGSRPIAEQLAPGLDRGDIFGRSYLDGLPTYNKCEEPNTTKPNSKCFRQKEYCSGPLLAFLQGAGEAGIGVSCDNHCQDVAGSVAAACSGGSEQCIRTCTDKAQTLSRSVCRQQCAMLCSQVGKIAAGCLLLPASVTVGWLCPELCAGAGPGTCAAGTSCRPPRNPHAASAGKILGMETTLFKDGQGLGREKVRYGAILTTRDKSVGSAVTLVHNTSGVHAVPALLNLVSSAMKAAESGPGSSISTQNHPMPVSSTELVDKIVSAAVNLLSTFVIIIAFSWIPAAIVAYVVREREAHHNCKHQQLISGVSLLAYWTANMLWDLCVYVAPLGLSMLFIYLFGISAFIENGALWATFVIFAGYGLAIAPFSYLLSFLFSKHTTAQILCLVINFVTGLILMITSYILSSINNTKEVNKSLIWLYRIFPGFCLGHGLFRVCTNSVAATQLGIQDSIDLLDWDVAGADACVLYLTAPAYFALTLLVDYLLHSPLAAAGKRFDPQVESLEEEEDEDVRIEAERLASGAADGDVVRLMRLRKVYRTPEGTPKVAVRGLSFGLARGECFGFLGINGAGKTSTLNMLTGAVLPSAGTAQLGGHDIVQEQWRVRRLLGYCPQHDALLDRLTVKEHLELFGRIKGLPRQALQAYCASIMEDLSLAEHVDKLAMTLSGGNKRKLSLAISLMGLPPLVLLDEPSTGVDPAARRLMWDAVSAISTMRKECCVMLTTHNMEEAEALCSRIGIMVGGWLQCLGSNQHLKARFGAGYQLEARLACPSEAEISASVREWQLPARIAPEQLQSVCRSLGAPARAELVREDCEQGYAVAEAFAREGSVSAQAFVEWWRLEEGAERLEAWLKSRFAGSVVIERHERTLRFRLPAGLSLAQLFERLEAGRAELGLEEYGISQTSLEQIFNDFAAKQQEETQAVRGLFAMGSAAAESADEAAGSLLELGATAQPAAPAA